MLYPVIIAITIIASRGRDAHISNGSQGTFPFRGSALHHCSFGHVYLSCHSFECARAVVGHTLHSCFPFRGSAIHSCFPFRGSAFIFITAPSSMCTFHATPLGVLVWSIDIHLYLFLMLLLRVCTAAPSSMQHFHATPSSVQSFLATPSSLLISVYQAIFLATPLSMQPRYPFCLTLVRGF